MKLILSMILVFVCIAWLTACSRITHENFDKIQTGMSMQEVIRVLGEPTTSDSFNVAGISGTSATWKYKNSVITLQFLNDKVQIKTFSNTGANNGDASGTTSSSSH